MFIKHIDGPLFFGSTSDFQQLSKQIPDTASTIIIRMGKVPYMDQSGLYVLEDILVDLKKDGKNVLLVDIQKQPRYMMERIDILPDLIPIEHTFETFKKCLDWVNTNVEDEF